MKDITDAERLIQLEKTVEDLTRRVITIERHSHYHPSAPTPQQPWNGNCPRCGLKLYTVMGYVCSVPDCPTGLGPVMC